MLRRASERLAIVLALCGAAGCKLPEKPGELVGAYAITGALIENSCGSDAVPARDPLRFNVEVRTENGAGLWLVSMPPAYPGRLDADGAFSFERESAFDVSSQSSAADPTELMTDLDLEALIDPERYQNMDAARQQPCRLLIRESVRGKLLRDSLLDGGVDEALDAGGDSQADLVADNEIDIRAASGNRCAQVLAENGGPFLKLPCTVRYELEGELVAP